uniref:Actin-related protein 6 n=1 Tax=Timema genevievae TaxID=629358 RepID=A0A7R9K3B4_TIMGE|nr:unnamed protein product [Timema genevievae]
MERNTTPTFSSDSSRLLFHPPTSLFQTNPQPQYPSNSEILFSPSDVGIPQMGIAEAITHSITSCPVETHPHLFANILLTGGCTLFKGFSERLLTEVRALAPVEFDVNIMFPPDPVKYSWQGGAILSKDPEFKSMLVTKEEYEEEGYRVCADKFDV